MIEKLIEFIAPDECIICQKEGLCLCVECSQNNLQYKKPACMMCNELNNNGRVCIRCRHKSAVYKATIAYRYDGVIKELISLMKYQGRRGVAKHLASLLPAQDLLGTTMITFVPSDGPTRRRRGYDQAELLAKHYARANGTKHTALLARRTHEKQVGKSRKGRIDNVKDNFVSTQPIAGSRVILVDDVVTTGATANECAKVLKSAGAKRVEVLAFAKK